MTDAALGALVVRWSDAKRRRAALLHEAEVMRDAFWAGSRAVDLLRRYGHTVTEAIVPPTPPAYPSAETLTEHLQDFRATCADLEHAAQQLKDAGIDLD